MARAYAIIAVTTIVALLAGIWYATTRGTEDALAACRQGGKVAGGLGAIGGPFTLVNQDGETVTDADVITGPTILYFGYTFCPDICPADTARNASAVEILEEDGYMVTPVMISIDPERDTPEVMGDFIFNLHERMIGLTGTPDQVRAASRAYKTYYKKQEEEDEEFYLVDHSTFTYFVMPEHGTVQLYGRDTTPQQMADSVSCFVDRLN